MDAERLYDVVSQFSAEMKELDVRGKLGAMVQALEQMIGSPNASNDQAFKAALDTLYVALESAPSNDWVPSKRKLLEAAGLAEITGRGLRNKIERIFTEQGLARQMALELLRTLTGVEKKRLGEADQTIAALQSMGIQAPSIPEGEAEVAFILPNSIDTATISTVEKELNHIDKLLRLLAEVYGEPVGSARVLSLNKGSLEVFVVAGYLVAKGLLELVDRVLNIWQRVIELKKHQRENERLNVPANIREQIEQYINSHMSDGAAELAEQIIARSPVQDQGRKNELRNQLVFEIKVLARHIDMGARVEVSVPQLEVNGQTAETSAADGEEIKPRQPTERELIRAELARRGSLMRQTPQLEQPVLALEDQPEPPPTPPEDKPTRRPRA